MTARSCVRCASKAAWRHPRTTSRLEQRMRAFKKAGVWAVDRRFDRHQLDVQQLRETLAHALVAERLREKVVETRVEIALLFVIKRRRGMRHNLHVFQLGELRGDS